MSDLLEQQDNVTIKNQIDFVAPVYIPEVWVQVEALLTRGLSKGEDLLTLPEIYHRLAMGEFILWTVQQEKVLKAVALTEVGAFHDGHVCFIYLLSGYDMETWITDLHEAILGWAREAGCRKVKALGRPGWKKYYKQHGWGIEHYEFSIPVHGAMH